MRRAVLSLTIAAALLGSSAARAQPRAEPIYTPSTFVYGFHGFLLGATAGVGAGYLVARSGGWHSDDWRTLGIGAGIGALVGGGLGLSLGIADMATEMPGRGYFVLRDGAWGLGFGTAAGAIAGGVVALSSQKGERVLLGASIGALAGTAVGLALGVVESQRVGRRMRPAVALSLTPAIDSHDQLVWLAGLGGKY